MENIIGRYQKLVKNVLLAGGSCAALVVIISLTTGPASIANTETVAFSFLLIVLFSAFFGNAIVSVIVSLVAALCFDYFYLPPFGTLSVDSVPDWISLCSFLVVAIMISNLTSSAADTKAQNSRLESTMGQLNGFGHWLISTPNTEISLSSVAEAVTQFFHVQYCSIHAYSVGKWDHYRGSAASELTEQIEEQIQRIDQPLAWTDLVTENELGVRYIPIQNGTETFAVMAVKDNLATTESLKSIAYLVGIRLSAT